MAKKLAIDDIPRRAERSAVVSCRCWKCISGSEDTRESMCLWWARVLGPWPGMTFIGDCPSPVWVKDQQARWHDRFADTLREEGFAPCKADTDIWMREKDGLCEYICVYIDDLVIAMNDPAALCEMLKSKHGYKLKGVSDLKYHKGCDFGRDPDKTYYYGPFNTWLR